MNRARTILAVTAVAFALALTSCAGEPRETAGEPPAPTPTAEASTPEPTETSEPLSAAQAPSFSDLDSKFLFELRKRTDIATIVQASDQQLIDAGHAACLGLSNDPNVDNLRLIEGEIPRDDGRYFESAVIGTHAAMFLCPELETD